MSVAVDPSAQADRQKCRAHVEACAVCLWSGGNRAGEPCVKCGGEVVRRPCKLWPMAGGVVCVKHGGRAPQVRKAGRRRLAQAKATRLAEAEYEPVTDPIATLADVAGRAVALMGVLELRVDALRDDIRYTATEAGTEQLRSEVSLLERAMDRAGKFAAELARLGFDERRVAVEEEQLKIVAAALQMALADVGIKESKPIIDAFAVRVVELEKAKESTPKELGK